MIENITGLRIDRNKNRIGNIRSAIVFATREEKDDEIPFLYLKRPKTFSEEQFDEIIESMTISINKVTSTSISTPFINKEKKEPTMYNNDIDHIDDDELPDDFNDVGVEKVIRQITSTDMENLPDSALLDVDSENYFCGFIEIPSRYK
jgi:hypothetical protein